MKLLSASIVGLLLVASASADPVIWNNGMNYQYLGASEDDGAGMDAIVADDFILDAGNTTITGVHWIGGFFNPLDHASYDWEITFYEDIGDGTTPAAEIASFYYLSTEVNELFLDQTNGVYYDYNVDLPNPVQFDAGSEYWLSIQANSADYPGGPQVGWAQHDSLQLHEAKFRSSLLGYPDWVDGSVVWGGYQQDQCFELRGVPAPGSLTLLGLAGLLTRRRR